MKVWDGCTNCYNQNKSILCFYKTILGLLKEKILQIFNALFHNSLFPQPFCYLMTQHMRHEKFPLRPTMHDHFARIVNKQSWSNDTIVYTRGLQLKPKLTRSPKCMNFVFVCITFLFLRSFFIYTFILWDEFGYPLQAPVYTAVF